MISRTRLRQRRRDFLARIEKPVLLFAGRAAPRNYPDNTYPPRIDSNFLYFFGPSEPGASALFDPAENRTTLFLPARSLERSIWEGSLPSLDEVGEAVGAQDVRDVERLDEYIHEIVGTRPLETVAVADEATRAQAAKITGKAPRFEVGQVASLELRKTLASLRHFKDDEEIQEIRAAVAATTEGFRRAMSRTAPGAPERELHAELVATYVAHGGTEAFPAIVSVRGETLHNHSHEGVLEEGDLVLTDSGAESSSGYASDVTRVWPATGRFSASQRSVYEIVHESLRVGIRACRAGARFRDVHFAAARVIAEGLVELGVLRGSADDLVAVGAHALFFPHGVGHLLGLDVHDMEAFGDEILYTPNRKRSDQFGTKFLRIDLDLAPRMVVTVEPGIYFVPAILHHAELRHEFRDHVDFDRAEQFLGENQGRGFGGIRIEDDVLVTESDPENLTREIPREIEEIEAIVGMQRTAGRA